MTSKQVVFDEICTKKKFDHEFQRKLKCKTLNISECSFQDAASLLSLQWFKDKLNQASMISSVNFAITTNTSLDEIKSQNFLKDYQSRLTIAFKSETQVFICWKNERSINVVDLSSLGTELQNAFISLQKSSKGKFLIV